MHRAARLEKTSPISDGFRRHPQTLSSPPPQSQVFSGTKESAGCIGPVHWPAAAECLTCYVRGRTLSRPLSASVCGKYDMPSRRPYERIAEGLISACRKHVVVATRLSPFKVGDNQRLERTMSGAAKTSAYFPLHDQPPTGTKESASPLTTPDMVRSGRVLQTSVKFPIPHNFSSESDKTAPAFHSPPRSATEAALSGLHSGL